MENKYRAWDFRNKKMIYDALQTSETGELVTVNTDYFNSSFSFFDGCNWMQYTGFDDVDGGKIYHKDVVEDRFGNVGVAEWHDERGAWIFQDGYNELLYTKMPLKKKGNTYENSDMER